MSLNTRYACQFDNVDDFSLTHGHNFHTKTNFGMFHNTKKE